MVTRKCNRNCPKCCNKSFDIDEEVPLVNGISQYDEILLTGGEPMLELERLLSIIETIRAIDGDKKVYVDA
jgi:molybdenum cofactor biosynthesis enzyme MoaA